MVAVGEELVPEVTQQRRQAGDFLTLGHRQLSLLGFHHPTQRVRQGIAQRGRSEAR